MSKIERAIFADPELFAAYQIGRVTWWRDEWMDKARKAPKCGRALKVKFAREYNQEAVRYARQIP